MKSKKAISVWVSAVLYFGIGITIIGIILAAGMPVVDRVRDKNIATQTKTVFYGFDKVIKEVAKEGGGSQRVMTVDLKKGNLYLDSTNDEISWNYTTKAVLSEPGIDIKEGPITIRTDNTQTNDVYSLSYKLKDYHCNIDINTSLEMISGTRELIVYNTGTVTKINYPECNLNQPKDVVVIEIKEV
jgi:type II secretory pathway pseudopilin PulG